MISYLQILNFGFLGTRIWGISLYSYITAFLVFVGVYILLKVFLKRAIVKISILTSKTKTDIDDLVIRVMYSVKTAFYLYASFYVALRTISLPEQILIYLDYGLIVISVYQVIVSLLVFIDYIFSKISAKKEDAGTKEALKTLSDVTKGIIWVVGILLILQNLGVNVTTIIAGLGIGGVAIALALQNILSDLFSSFAILFDKPFVPGDFIVVGKHMGVVEKIGIKTTKIRDLQGEQIVMSNKELTGSTVMNFKRMTERRVPFKFGVEYGTSNPKLKKISDIVKDAVESTKNTRFDRTNFVNFDDSALSFEAVYYVLSPDYNEFLKIHEDILLKIKAGLEKDKISFAFPSQSIYLKR